MRKLLTGAGVLLAGVGVFAAVSIGDQSSTRRSVSPTGREHIRVAAHRVSSPSKAALAPAAAGRGSGFRKLVYKESRVFAVPDEGVGVSLKCPRHSGAIDGYFGSAGGVVLDFSAIAAHGIRRWDFGLFNVPQTGDVNAFVGVICLK
jgi:hypothetical protein